MNSAWTGAVNKIKAMDAAEKAKTRQSLGENEELPPIKDASLNRRQSDTPSKLFVTDVNKDSPIMDVENNFSKLGGVLPDIMGNGQMYGIGERQEFIENVDTKFAWNTPRESNKQIT